MKQTIKFFISILLSIVIACIIGYQVDKQNINGTGGYLLGEKFSSNDILYHEFYDYQTNKKFYFTSNSFTLTENNYFVKNKTDEKNVFYSVKVNKNGIITAVTKGIKLNKYDNCSSIQNSLKIQLEKKYDIKSIYSDQINKNNRSITFSCLSPEIQKIHENYLLSIDYHNDEFLTKDFFEKKEIPIKGAFGYFLGKKTNNIYNFSDIVILKNGNKQLNVEPLYIENEIMETLDKFLIITDNNTVILYIKAIKENINDCENYRKLFFSYFAEKHMIIGQYYINNNTSIQSIFSQKEEVSLICKKNNDNEKSKFTISIGYRNSGELND